MSETCPLYTKLAKRYYECDRFIASLCERFADEISYCGKYSGYNITPCRSNSTIFNLQLLYDTLYIEVKIRTILDSILILRELDVL